MDWTPSLAEIAWRSSLFDTPLAWVGVPPPIEHGLHLLQGSSLVGPLLPLLGLRQLGLEELRPVTASAFLSGQFHWALTLLRTVHVAAQLFLTCLLHNKGF